MLLYDKTELVESNLLLPGVKPVGPVKINWDHPFTEGLRHFYLFDGPIWRDYVTGLGPTSETGRVQAIRKHAYFDGSSYLLMPTRALTIPEGPHTVLYKCDNVQTNTWQVFANLYSQDLTDGGSLTFSSNSSWRPVVFSIVRNSTNVDLRFDWSVYGISSEGLHTWGWSYNGNGSPSTSNVVTCKDGVFTAPISAPSQADSGSPWIGEGAFANNELHGTAHYLAVWDRNLSQAIQRKFIRHPFQIFIPD